MPAMERQLPNRIDSLRKILIEEKGFSMSEIRNKSKEEIIDMIQSADEASDLISNAEVSKDLSDDISEAMESSAQEDPEPTSPRWTEWVLGQLIEGSEIENNNPKVDGLRRIAFKLYGAFSTDVFIEQVPTNDNNQRATVKVSVIFNDGRVVSAAADVSPGNTGPEFAKHPVATAESRAEGRALRKALYLTKVLTAEEVDGVSVMQRPISDSLKQGIETAASRRNVVVGTMIPKVNPDKTVLDELTQQEGSTLLALINQHKG